MAAQSKTTTRRRRTLSDETCCMATSVITDILLTICRENALKRSFLSHYVGRMQVVSQQLITADMGICSSVERHSCK